MAGMSGDVPDETIHDNFAAIMDLAKVNGVKVVWVSTLPADHLFWRPSLEPAERIAGLVKWEKEYAAKSGADMQFKSYYWLMGAIGADRVKGKVLGYGSIWGSGAAVVEFTA